MLKLSRYLNYIILMVILITPVLYYQEKLIAYASHPKRIIDLILSVSGLGAFALQFVFIDLGIFLLAACIDLISFGWKKSAVRRLFVLRDPSARGDLWCWLLSVFSLYDFIALLFSFGIFYLLSGLIVRSGNFQLIHYIPQVWLQFLLIFILSDLKQYTWHRFMHLMPFWELHKYHHSATEFNLITNSRGHFLEKGILLIFDSILFSIVGAPLYMFSFFVLLREFYNQLLHSDLNWSLGFLGKYVLISPKDHRLHHSDDQRFYDKNFGTFFVFWDKLFFTYASTQEKIHIGVKNDPYNKHGFWWDMLEGMRAFFRAIGIEQRKKG